MVLSSERTTEARAAVVRPGVFLRYDPGVPPVPVVVDVSRSGREYPPEFRSPLPFTVLHGNVTMYVEELWATAPDRGATLLYCCFPNTFIDTNRSIEDLEPAVVDGVWPAAYEPSPNALRGVGLIKTKSKYGEPLQERRLTVPEIEDRLERYHRPYHDELGRLIRERHEAFGIVRKLACHCMDATDAPTNAGPGKPRADFCIGDGKGTTSSATFVSLVAETLRSCGYSVAVNDPFTGAGPLNHWYAAPDRGIDSISIEINKKLFMDVATHRATAGLARVKADLDRLLAVVAADSVARARRSG